MLLPGVMQAAWAGGSDKPEQTRACGSDYSADRLRAAAIAAAKGIDQKYGITLVASKEASRAAVRDKLVAGELDAAHILYAACRTALRHWDIASKAAGDGQFDDPQPQWAGDYPLQRAGGEGVHLTSAG